MQPIPADALPATLPRRSSKARRALRFLIPASWLTCVAAWILLYVETETVMGTGPAMACLGTVAIIAGGVARYWPACAIGAAHWAVCLLFFGLVVTCGWGPYAAHKPFLVMGAVYLAAITPLSLYAWRRVPPTRMPWECARCGYLLFGLTEPRCPECGQPFDPSRIPPGAEPA